MAPGWLRPARHGTGPTGHSPRTSSTVSATSRQLETCGRLGGGGEREEEEGGGGEREEGEERGERRRERERRRREREEGEEKSSRITRHMYPLVPSFSLS